MVTLDITKEKIKERLDPIRVLESLGVMDYSLQGSTIRCRCPIHHGDGDNFSWDTSGYTPWSCFSKHCGEEYGIPRDSFLLVMLVKDISFPQSVQYLAEVFGISYNKDSYNKNEDDEYKVKRWLQKQKSLDDSKNTPIDEEVLKNFSKEPHPYLLNRGFTPGIIHEFEIAYAKSGVFQNRIIVPIRDDESRLVGFSGRIASDDKGIIKNEHKYKNMMNFSSGVVLYGLNKAKPFIEREGKVVLVEGFFDVVLSAHLGIRNICATMGTTILPEQINLVIKHTDTVYLAYDGDDAGRRGAWKIYNKLHDYCDVRFMDVPDNQDLGSLSEQEVWDLYSNPIRALDYFDTYKSILNKR